MSSLKKKIIFEFAFVFALLFLFTSGFSSFIYSEQLNSESSLVVKENVEPVAYIKEDTSGTYYLDIEEAIDDANNYVKNGWSNASIVIIPGSAVSLDKSKTLLSGVDLLLPYSLVNGDLTKESNGLYPAKYIYGANYDTTTHKPEGDYAKYAEYGSYSPNFSDNNEGAFLKSTLIINSNISLTLSSGSNLVVFSQLGRPSNGVSGASSGSYSQIIMMENSTININSGAVLDCRGYIKEGFSTNPVINGNKKISNGSIINNNGTIYSPFVIYDYGGGNSTVAIYVYSDECPFSSYDLPQIHVNVRNKFGGLYKTRADLYTGYVEFLNGVIKANPQHNTCYLDFFGNSSSSIYKFNDSNAEATYKYYPNTYYFNKEMNIFYGKTENIFSKGRDDSYGGTSTIIFSGDISISYLTINVSVFGKNVEIKTDNIYFPVPFNYELIFNNCYLNLSNDIKFMSGSRVIFNQTEINSAKNVAVYGDDFTDASSEYSYPNNLASLFLLNGSTFNILSGSIGGVIQTTGDSVLNVQNVNVVAAPVTDSAGGSLALENIEGLDYAALMGFMANGKLTDGVKSALKNACGNSVSQVVQNNLLLKAKLNDSNNLVELKSLSKYHSESNCDYFLELVVTFVNLNIEVYKKSGGYLDFEAFGIDIYIYSDSDLNNLILGPNTYTEKYYHQTNSASINTINGEYYVLVKKSSKSQSNVNTLNITTDDGSSPGGTGDVNNDGYLFKLNNKNWTIRVEN